MPPEMVSLMQQLVTAVQSIALSVDVMSVDLRSLNRNVARMAVKREVKEEAPPKDAVPALPLVPECSYTPNDEAASQVMPSAEHVSAMEAASSYHSDLPGDDPEPRERLRDSLREDITKAMGRSSGMDVARWQKECGEALSSTHGEGSLWEGFDQLQTDTRNPAESTEIENRSHNSDTRKFGPPGRMLNQGEPRKILEDQSRKKGAKVFKCVWCAKEFSDNCKLKRHWRVHTGEKPFQCFQCGKSFAYKEKLVVHRRIHSGERPFRCDVCGKAFIQKENLIVHGRVHTGERPYSCDVCGKAFKDSGNLSRHKRVHL